AHLVHLPARLSTGPGARDGFRDQRGFRQPARRPRVRRVRSAGPAVTPSLGGNSATLPGINATPASIDRRGTEVGLRGRLRRGVAMSAGGAGVRAVVAVAFLAPVIDSHNPIANSLVDRLKPPSRAPLFGTDDFGRDVFSRVVWGARVSLLVAAV